MVVAAIGVPEFVQVSRPAFAEKLFSRCQHDKPWRHEEDLVRVGAFFLQGSWVKPGAVVIDVGINYVDAPERKALGPSK